MPHLLRLLCIAVPVIALSACSNTTSDMHYTVPATVARAAVPVVSGVTAIDQRKEEAHRLATIMGGFGNPLKTLDLARPVKDEVADAFTEGLRVRGLLADQGPYRIELLIRKYDADMLMGSTGRIDLDLSVIDKASQQVIYKDSAANERSDFHFFATGVFASMDELQKLAQEALDATVDQMLDKSAFRAAVEHRPSARQLIWPDQPHT